MSSIDGIIMEMAVPVLEELGIESPQGPVEEKMMTQTLQFIHRFAFRETVGALM